MKGRARLLEELVNMERPVREVREELVALGWDSEENLVLLTPGHVRCLLERFVAGTIVGDDVTSWAEAIEGREDIGVPDNSEAVLKEAIFELANPDLTEPLTVATAQRLIRGLDVIQDPDRG